MTPQAKSLNSQLCLKTTGQCVSFLDLRNWLGMKAIHGRHRKRLCSCQFVWFRGSLADDVSTGSVSDRVQE